MTLSLEQIIQMGGPTGFALLFAWLWTNAVKKAEAKEKILQAKLDSAQEARLSESVDNAKAVMQIANDVSKSLDLISAKVGNGRVQ